MIPKWRQVEYTDDGCYSYQCLSCYNSWEGRTAPGRVVDFKKVYGSKKGVSHFKDEGGLYYFEDIEPEYKPYWRWCPYCGVEWEGPVCLDTRNERMLGPRRLHIQELMREHYKSPEKHEWTIEESYRGIWKDPKWHTYGKTEAQAFKAHHHLNFLRSHYKSAFRIKELS